MQNALALLKQGNFTRLLTAVFVSELGGYVTNVMIYLHIYDVTGGNLFYLGLAQVLFIAPLMLGTLCGGVVGEKFSKTRIMITCESANLVLILMLATSPSLIWLILSLRSFIVFFAGVFNPSRMAVMRELAPREQIGHVNGAFSSLYALLHCSGPLLGVWAYYRLESLNQMFWLNALTYLIAILLLLRLRLPDLTAGAKVNWLRDFRGGMQMIGSRSDLRALLRNCSFGGLCLGVFFPTLKPFLSERLDGTADTYALILSAFGVGGVVGGISSIWLIRRFGTGRILVSMTFLQTLFFAVWTQTLSIKTCYVTTLLWGASLTVLLASYVNYVQFNISGRFHARTFALFDQSIFLNSVLGALVVTLVGHRISPYELLTWASGVLITIVCINIFSTGVRQLYATNT